MTPEMIRLAAGVLAVAVLAVIIWRRKRQVSQ